MSQTLWSVPCTMAELAEHVAQTSWRHTRQWWRLWAQSQKPPETTRGRRQASEWVGYRQLGQAWSTGQRNRTVRGPQGESCHLCWDVTARTRSHLLKNVKASRQRGQCGRAESSCHCRFSGCIFVPGPGAQRSGSDPGGCRLALNLPRGQTECPCMKEDVL